MSTKIQNGPEAGSLVHLYLKVDFFLKNNLKVYEIALRCQFQSRL